MSLSIAFSGIIYQVASNEIQTRLANFKSNLEESIEYSSLFTKDTVIHASEELWTSNELIIELIYLNGLVFISGGFISYFLARRNLTPIQKVHEAQSRFTSDTSHELRTPLAVMKTELEVALRDKEATTHSLKEVLSSNLEEVDKLSKLAEMLLDLSQLDNTKLKLCAVNLNKITREAINGFKKPKERIKLETSKNQIVYGNDVAIMDLIKVLIDNAIQYSPNDSTVRISICKLDEEYTKFEITNKGAGIQHDKLPYVFDRFYRADTSRTKGDHKGYGLGLALAKNIAELHNGTLKVSSKPGKETTFTLTLPLNSSIKNKS